MAVFFFGGGGGRFFFRGCTQPMTHPKGFANASNTHRVRYGVGTPPRRMSNLLMSSRNF